MVKKEKMWFVLFILTFILVGNWGQNTFGKERKLVRVISAGDFISSGNGTKANPWSAQAIQKAINALPNGGEVFIPKGYYYLY